MAGSSDQALRIEVHASLDTIAAEAWNALAGEQLFVRHEFLHALQRSGCVTPDTGWTPQYLTLTDDGQLVGAMPLYLKTHSYGEYVFDWAWADAYQRSGLPYFPKLLCAVPFTPVSGARLLARTDAGRDMLVASALALAQQMELSSLHVLYTQPPDRAAAARAGMMAREGVQFHWHNRRESPPGERPCGAEPFTDFDDFLSTMTHDKRKKVRQERRRVRDAGISYRWKRGREIGEGDWAFFYHCYADTYRRHGHSPYLSLEFFLDVAQALPEAFVLVLAERSDAGVRKPVACALDVHCGDRVYGRYWGSAEWHSGLHFETCYYQSIEYCIAHGAAVFEGGAQGEHKLARGLAPVVTHSAHWLAHPQFARAVGDFLAREARGIAHYVDELNEHTPFRALGQAADGDA